MAKVKKKEIVKREKKPAPKSTEERVNHILAIQRQNDIIALLIEGKEDKEIALYIANKYRILFLTAKQYISGARAEIRSRTALELNTLLALHIQRYENIYERLYTIGAYAVAMMAMRAKEKLMQFHKENFHMRVTSGEIAMVGTIHVQNEYDYMKIGEKSVKRLKFLLDKTKEKKKIANG